MSRRVIAAFSAFLFLLGGISCYAVSDSISAASYVVYEAQSGRILLEKDAKRQMSIASTTKILTALTALDCGNLSDKMTVRKEHLQEGSSMYLALGEQVSMETLLCGLMLSSGNDAAECLTAFAKSREAFIEKMNEKAAEVGMIDSSFANPSGLEQDGHYSTALDMAKLMAYAMQNPTFSRFCATRDAVCGTRRLHNHNKLLTMMNDCVGGKTGFTKKAGRTLVSAVKRNGLVLICVTLNAPNDWSDHQALYDAAAEKYRACSVLSCDDTFALCAVRGGWESAVFLVPQSSLVYPLCDGETVRVVPDYQKELHAPLYEGETIGTAKVYFRETLVAAVPLICTRTVEKIN